jgi:hypothetical protein
MPRTRILRAVSPLPQYDFMTLCLVKVQGQLYVYNIRITVIHLSVYFYRISIDMFCYEYLIPIDLCTPRVVTGEKNSPTVAHACRKRRLKWVLGAWGYNWAHPVSRGYTYGDVVLQVGGWAWGYDPTPEKVNS